MASKYKIKVGIIGGSGLNNPNFFKDEKELDIDTPFGKPSDVLISGKIENVDCVLLARHGRQHTISPTNVNYRANIWALKKAGCTHVIASSASGSLQEHIKPGDMVVVDSFIDRTTKRSASFYDGSVDEAKGVCHIPMEPAFCNKTRQILIEAAEELAIPVHSSGTSVSIEGPRFSSRAESNLYRSWGIQLVNMTLVPEVVLAKEAGLCYAVVAMATDYDCWRISEEGVNVSDVLKTFKENVEKITKLFLKVVPRIAEENWDDTIDSLKATVESSIMLPQSKK
ncbi:S-methyl-5'-thioadenosine phosphorylase-like [Nilaparvata lugens]|uniref:S-methyl-5'-thioadenosine phosphorylase-like n=1 Tax=Nilaparvata lugens TaxID=108931 RepID=UPI00193D7029|nr:S-methyl-5'-thioadenosine phosphorylase-like [Nilaparvata lugens]